MKLVCVLNKKYSATVEWWSTAVVYIQQTSCHSTFSASSNRWSMNVHLWNFLGVKGCSHRNIFETLSWMNDPQWMNERVNYPDSFADITIWRRRNKCSCDYIATFLNCKFHRPKHVSYRNSRMCWTVLCVDKTFYKMRYAVADWRSSSTDGKHGDNDVKQTDENSDDYERCSTCKKTMETCTCKPW